METWNTIIMLKGESILTYREMREFQKGDTIWGVDRVPQEVRRWEIGEEKAARAALAEKKCSYRKGIKDTYIEEYALQYCDVDVNGDFMSGADYDLAEEEEED